jgi:tetratricopeptide (TPR) repeat protein
VSLWGQDVETAEAHLKSAARLRKLPADERDLAALASCEALVDARRGRFAQARARAAEALGALAEAPAEQGMALVALALAAAREGEVDAAGDAFAKAVDALELSGDYHEAAGVCREWAAMLKRARRTQAADDVERRASSLARHGRREAAARMR